MAQDTVENPVKMTEETVKKLEEAFAIDASVEEACFYANISKQTYYNWMRSFPDMQERFDALRQKPILKARQTVVKSLDQPNYAFEYLKRKKKAEFGDHIDVTSGDKPFAIYGGASVPKHDGNQEDIQPGQKD